MGYSRRRRVKGAWPWLWAIALVLAFVAVAGFVSASIEDHEVAVIESAPGVAQATVVEVETHYGRRGRRTYEPTVQFVTDEGVTRRVGLATVRDRDYYAIGDVITIRYATSNPEYSYDERRPLTPDLSRLVGWVVSPFALAMGVVAVFFTRRHSRRIAHGLVDS